jgi:hypothetical protein
MHALVGIGRWNVGANFEIYYVGFIFFFVHLKEANGSYI